VLPAANAAHVYVNKIRLRVIAHSTAAHRQRRIANLRAGNSWNANIDGLRFHVLAMLGNSVPMLPQVVIAPWRAVPADDIYFAVGMSQLGHQIVQQIEFLEVIILHVTGAVVTQKMVQLRDTVRKVLITNPIDHINMFARVQVIEPQPIGRSIRLAANVRSAAWEYTQQCKENKQLSGSGALKCHAYFTRGRFSFIITVTDWMAGSFAGWKRSRFLVPDVTSVA
jgi:hypothetical protein